MRSRLLRLLAVLALSVSLGWSQAAALAQEPSTEGTATSTDSTIGGEGDNVAVAIATKDGQSKFKVSFRIVRTSSDVIDNSNIAFAFASCEGCSSIAIAFQIVLVSGSPSTVIPENYAIALNFECVDCATLASAYQFVLGVDGNVHFSPEGNRALARISMAIRELAGSELPVDEIQAELDLLADDLRTVLANEIVTAGPPGVEVEEEQATATPAPTGSPASSPSPTAEPSPSPETTETSEPAVSPSPEASVSPSGGPSPTPSASSSP